MANLYSKTTGNWSTLGTFNTLANGTGTNQVPTNADDCFIQTAHTVALDGTTCVAKSVQVTAGTLTASTSVNTKLTVENNIDNNGGTINIDISGVSVTCDIVLNNARSATAGTGKFNFFPSSTTTLKGNARKRKTTLVSGIAASATTATVADATGWAMGDTIVFATTQAYNATPKTDVITIATVDTGTGVITWSGGVTYAHAAGGYVGNFSSNLTVRPSVAKDGAYIYFNYASGSSFNTKTFSNVLFTGFKVNNFDAYSTFGVAASNASASADPKTSVADCAFYNFEGCAVSLNSASTSILFDRDVFYSSANNGLYFSCSAFSFIGGNQSGSFIRDCGIFQNTGSGTCDGIGCSVDNNASELGLTVSDTFISSCNGYGWSVQGANLTATNVEVFSNNKAAWQGFGSLTASNFNVGTFNSNACTNGSNDTFNIFSVLTFTDSKTQALDLTNLSSAKDGTTVTYINKNQDVTLQEIYRPYMEVKRYNTVIKRSTSAVSIKPTRTGTNSTKVQTIPCAAGASIRIIGYVQKSHATNISATVSLSGLGSAWGGFTAANDTSVQGYDTGVITNSTGVAGNYTLTYTANSSATGNTAYFDGVPDGLFVTTARHYGYIFDESNPSRVTDPTNSANESTAAAITGVNISGSTSSSPWSLGANRTFQQAWDFSRAYCCLNLTYKVPLDATGVPGSIALVAKADVTTTGYTLDGGGSLAMGSNTLTANQPWSYSYTGGTFSQAAGSGLPVFQAGTLTLSTTGTRTLQITGGQITFSAAGTYVMSASTLAGNVNLVNTSGGSVTVQVAAGQSYTNTGPNITISAPAIYQSVTVSGAVAGTRIQIYDATSSTELYNGTPSFPYTWTDSVAAASSRAIRLRVAKQATVTAYYFIEANIGTCGVTSGDAAVSYLVSQTADTTYNTNAIDGSTVTGITITPGPGRVSINLAGGSTTYPRIYAYQVYWLATATGIADEAAFISAPDTANYLFTGFKLKNTSATPLTITGGYGRDATTGLVADIIDVAGSTGNIYPQPDHAIPYSSGSGLTAGQAAALTAIQASTANLTFTGTAVQADIRKVTGITVTGTGQTATPWGP